VPFLRTHEPWEWCFFCVFLLFHTTTVPKCRAIFTRRIRT